MARHGPAVHSGCDLCRHPCHGGLDFVADEYRDVTIALVDADGCAKAQQKITGAFGKPIADQSGILLPVGSIVKLLNKARTLIAGEGAKCEVFYSGSVSVPK